MTEFLSENYPGASTNHEIIIKCYSLQSIAATIDRRFLSRFRRSANHGVLCTFCR